MDWWLVLYIIDGTLFVVTAGTVLYMGIFAVASLFSRHNDIPKSNKKNRIVILIPAYKQDKVIEHTVLAILSQSYPQRMFDVVVISDHQSEMTNMRLAQYPITLLTPNFAESTKAKSLQYAILNLPEFKIYDIAVTLDADNIVEQEFLNQVNDAFEIAATKAIQTHRISRNRDTTPMKGLSDTQRQKNLKNAFNFSQKGLQLERVLLVDDIYTTGATMDSVAKVLRDAGVKEVYGLCMCVGKGYSH